MKKHTWKFARFGGVMQLIIETPEDILHLKELDQKLWTVLSMPTKGIFFDIETAEALDTDNDGFIRPPEILQAVEFLNASLNDISLIMSPGDSISVTDIKDKNFLSSAKWFLERFSDGKKSISLADISNEQKALKEKDILDFNDNDTEELKFKKVIARFVRENPESTSSEVLEKIRVEKDNYLNWHKNLQNVTNGLELNDMLKAVNAFDNIADKIDDYFIRCDLIKYDENSKEILTNYGSFVLDFLNINLTTENEKLKSLPLSNPNFEKVLQLKEKTNPAWATVLHNFYTDVILQFCGEVLSITETDWKDIKAKISEFKSFYISENEALIAKIGLKNLDEFDEAKVLSEVEQRITFENEKGNVQSLKKLLLLRRDFFTLLKNYVSFSDFYSGKGSIFQAGVMFFDTKEAHLCFNLSDDPRHASLDIFSGAYLLYCDIFRGEQKKKVLCLLTNGSVDNILVGQNALFYDREGNDWNATVTKIVSNPISIREAFFSPYKSLVRLIEEQVAKRASAAEEKSNALIASTAEKSVNADKTQKTEAPKKLDLGTIALIGTAIGGISTLVGSILSALFGLGFWVPLGLLGLLLLISGPSMILATMKLRKRSIAPILEANGWAINVHTRINISLGTSLTKLSKLPNNSKLEAFDPFAKKKKGKKFLIMILILLLIAGLTFCYFYFIKNIGPNPLKWFKLF